VVNGLKSMLIAAIICVRHVSMLDVIPLPRLLHLQLRLSLSLIEILPPVLDSQKK